MLHELIRWVTLTALLILGGNAGSEDLTYFMVGYFDYPMVDVVAFGVDESGAIESGDAIAPQLLKVRSGWSLDGLTHVYEFVFDVPIASAHTDTDGPCVVHHTQVRCRLSLAEDDYVGTLFVKSTDGRTGYLDIDHEGESVHWVTQIEPGQLTEHSPFGAELSADLLEGGSDEYGTYEIRMCPTPGLDGPNPYYRIVQNREGPTSNRPIAEWHAVILYRHYENGAVLFERVFTRLVSIAEDWSPSNPWLIESSPDVPANAGLFRVTNVFVKDLSRTYTGNVLVALGSEWSGPEEGDSHIRIPTGRTRRSMTGIIVIFEHDSCTLLL